MTMSLRWNVFLGAFHKPARYREQRWGACGQSKKRSPVCARNLCPPSCTTYDSGRWARLYHIGCLWLTWTRFWRSLWHLVDPMCVGGAVCQAHLSQREMGSEPMQVQIQARVIPRWHCPPQPVPGTRRNLETLEEGSTIKWGVPVEWGLGTSPTFLLMTKGNVVPGFGPICLLLDLKPRLVSTSGPCFHLLWDEGNNLK